MGAVGGAGGGLSSGGGSGTSGGGEGFGGGIGGGGGEGGGIDCLLHETWCTPYPSASDDDVAMDALFVLFNVYSSPMFSPIAVSSASVVRARNASVARTRTPFSESSVTSSRTTVTSLPWQETNAKLDEDGVASPPA